MTRIGNKESVFLLLGDIFVFVASLWLTLVIRYEMVPTAALWSNHIGPFSILFFLWVVVYFILDLYGRQKLAFRRKLFGVLLRAHITNNIFAVLLFYFVPGIGIAPKVNFILYSFISFGCVVAWRVYIVEWFVAASPDPMAVLGEGESFDQLRAELAVNPRYGYRLADESEAVVIVTDLYAHVPSVDLQKRYHRALAGTRFIDIRDFYASVFDRLPLELLAEGWFLRNLPRNRTGYDILKRAMDIVVALPLAAVSLVLYPLVAIAIKLEDGGSVFIEQERVGRGGKPTKIYKFRSMSRSDSGVEVLKSKAHVTKIGAFLRKSRIDELPQLWSVVRGDLSLVGPRPELPALAEIYSKEIEHYDVRHTIKPGLSGWAQIYHEQHPHHGTAVQDTRDKLSYDLFYIKNRSFVLDLKIALKTLKILVSFVGR